MVIATALVAFLLLSLRLPESLPAKPIKIDVRLVAEEPTTDPDEEFTSIEELPIPETRLAATVNLVPDEVSPAAAATRDWYADIETVAREAVDASESRLVMQPAQLEARRRAAIHFAPSRAPVKKPIWENVEIDHIGRKVLVSGDCYRVLEDWRATYQEIQREFGQYMVHCSGVKRYPIDVDWVNEVGQKYAYVRYPDGEIPPDELNDLIRKY
jgi:hypothetical protein